MDPKITKNHDAGHQSLLTVHPYMIFPNGFALLSIPKVTSFAFISFSKMINVCLFRRFFGARLILSCSRYTAFLALYEIPAFCFMFLKYRIHELIQISG